MHYLASSLNETYWQHNLQMAPHVVTYLDVDLSFILDKENDVTMLFVLFDLFIGSFASVRYCYTGSLKNTTTYTDLSKSNDVAFDTYKKFNLRTD